jgi:type IV secretion system protein VirD4
MSAGVKYGLQRRKKTAISAGRWVILALVVVWVFVGFAWGAGRIAACFDYHPALGTPLEAFGRLLYWPWKVWAWQEMIGQYREVRQIVAQTYLVALGVPMLLGLVYYLASQHGLKGREDLHGSAKWAVREDIDGMGYLRGSGVYVGGWYDEKKKKHFYLRHDGPEHVIVFAPTRSGKGVGLIIPTLLTGEYFDKEAKKIKEYSSVVLDIKGENYALTAGQMAAKGHKVLRFNPADYEGTSAAFNPFGELHLDSPMLIADTQGLATIIMDPKGEGLKDYWGMAGCSFLVGALLHCLIKMRKEDRVATLYDLALMLEDPERPISEVLEEMLEMEHEEILLKHFPDMADDLADEVHITIASAARGMQSKAGPELSGVLNTVTSNLALYKDPVVKLNTSRNDFYLEDLMNYEVPVNLYLVIPPNSRKRLRPLLRLFITQLLNRFTERMDFADGASKQSYKHRLLLLLDEFTSLNNLEVFDDAIAFMAGYGVKGYFIVQDTAQLHKHYGKDNALFPNCHIRIAYAPTQVPTAEMLSKLVGTTTVVEKKSSISQGRGGDSRTTNISETARPLLTTDECLRLPGITMDKNGRQRTGDMLILTAGNAPIYGRQILYFLDPYFKVKVKIPPPGVAEGWSRGLSHSLHHPMPINNTKPTGQPGVAAVTEKDLVKFMAPDLSEAYKDYLARAGGE